MGQVLRSIFTSKSWWGSIFALSALIAIVDNRMPNGIFDRNKWDNDNTACIDQAFDDISSIQDIHLEWRAAVPTLVESIGEMSPEEGADFFHRGGEKVQSYRAHLLQVSPPTCLSNITDRSLNDWGFETVTNSDLAVFQEDVHRLHGAALVLMDTSSECLTGLERMYTDPASHSFVSGSMVLDAVNTLCDPVITAGNIFDTYFNKVVDFLTKFVEEFDRIEAE